MAKPWIIALRPVQILATLGRSTDLAQIISTESTYLELQNGTFNIITASSYLELRTTNQSPRPLPFPFLLG